MRGECIIRPRPAKMNRDKERELAKRAKEALARAASMSEGPQKSFGKMANPQGSL